MLLLCKLTGVVTAICINTQLEVNSLILSSIRHFFLQEHDMENSENGVHLIQISVRDLSMCLTGFLLSVVVKIEKRIRRMFRAEVLTVTSSSAMMDWPVGRGHVTALSCDYVTRSRLFPEYHY